VKLFLRKVYGYILHTQARIAGSELAVTGLHLSPARDAGPFIHEIMFDKNSFLRQANEMGLSSFNFWRCLIIFFRGLYVSLDFLGFIVFGESQ
jgi:hypothetical protein